jgi:FKBP-type peptidyl-prolyl cis-trans isomerase FklB
MKKSKLMLLALTLVSALGLVSCKEEDNTVVEYANWQSVNDSFVQSLATDSMKKEGWTRYKSWSLSTDSEGSIADYIYVKKLESGVGTVSPVYTDTVSVVYQGRLLPSVSYPSGYVFDQSYSGVYDPDTSSPAEFSASALVDGFSTALQNMHAGDRWMVYIPYQLGYGATEKTSIPAYSTLIFEITLVDFWRAKKAE